MSDGRADLEGTAAFRPDLDRVPPADTDAEPAGYVVLGAEGVRLHFLDWSGPPDADPVLLLPGLLQPAWSWTPVARRLRAARRVVVADLRGQGLSDAPMAGYDLASLAGDALAVADGAGLGANGRLVVAGHGFGGFIAARVAAALGRRCLGVVLVDGGWERLEETSGLAVDEFLRGLDEPPEVMRSLAAYLDDRRAFDPPTWDVDQERAARDGVVETAAGRVVRVVRPHVVEAMVRTMYDSDPVEVLRNLECPVVLLAARDDGGGRRDAELGRVARAVALAGRPPIRLARFPADGHNLMRYRPAEVAAAILSPSD